MHTMMEGKGITHVYLTIMLVVATLITGCNGQCGSSSPLNLTVTRNQIRIFRSPYYPVTYPNNADCSWLISADGNSTVTVTVLEMALEDSSACDIDFVSLYDGDSQNSPVLAVLCGRRYRWHSYHSTGRHLLVRLITDSYLTDEGFELEYTAVHPDAEKQRGPCGPDSMLTLTATRNVNGTIRSPNYPHEYPNYAFCSWNITTDPNFVIRVDVVWADMEEDNNCPYDFIALVDGVNFTLRNALRICSDLFDGAQIYSGGPYMLIYFITDSTLTRRGFELRYTAATMSEGANNTLPSAEGNTCGETVELSALPTTTQFLESPNYPNNYPRGYSCTWKIRADPGHVVEMTVADMELEPHTQCTYDSVIIYDSDYTTELNTYCHPNAKGRTDMSSQRDMYVRFTSDASIVFKGFRLGYTAVNIQTTTATSPTVSPKPPKDNTVAVLAGVMGAVILLCLIAIVVLIFCFLRRSKRSSSQTGGTGTLAVRPPSALYHSNQQDGMTLVNADYMLPSAHPQADNPPVYTEVPPSMSPAGAYGGMALPAAEALPTKNPIPDA